MRICKVEGCERSHHANGYCKMHYRRNRTHGDPNKVAHIVNDDTRRFWSKVDQRADDECWPWLGTVTTKGYGQFTYGSTPIRAVVHRMIYEITHGPIPDDLTIDHVWARGCTRRDCVNPAHLEAVTNVENIMRGNAAPALNARKETCPRGHEYTPYKGANGNTWRKCKECQNAAKRASRAANAQSIIQGDQ